MMKRWQKFRHKILGLGFYACLALGVILILTVWEYRIKQKERLREYEPAPSPAVGVTVALADKGEMSRWIFAEGIAQAVRKTHLRFEEEGRIIHIAEDTTGQKLREGSSVSGPGNTHAPSVSRGQLLAKLDSRDKHSRLLQSEAALTRARKALEVQLSALNQAEAQRLEAELDMKRKNRLARQNIITRSDYDKVQARYKIALAEVQMAHSRIEEAKALIQSAEQERDYAVRGIEKRAIYAPFKGIIARINIREGDYFSFDSISSENKPALLESAPITLIDPDLIEAVLYLPQFLATGTRPGQKAVVTPAMETWSPGTAVEDARKAQGVVHSVSPHIDAARRAVRIKVRLVPGNQVILDGLAVSCWIQTELKQEALKIPTASLLYAGSHPYVYLVKNNRACRQLVKTGIEDQGYSEVTEGLSMGDRIVLRGKLRLYNGTRLRIIPEQSKERLVTYDR